jgi:MFS transporter, putative metabolite:H+ symporter
MNGSATLAGTGGDAHGALATPVAGNVGGLTVGALFEDMPLTRRHWLIGASLFFVFVVEAWEMMIIVLAGQGIKADLAISDPQLGSLMGAIFLGMIPGALIWGRVIDRVGRRRALMASMGGYGALSLASCLAPGFESLWALRFACGLLLAGAVVTTFPFFEELLPNKARGKASVYLASGWPIGILLAVGTTWLLGDLGWRWVLAGSSVASVVAMALVRGLPESPHWLADRGRFDEARAVLARLSQGAHLERIRTVALQARAVVATRSIFTAATARVTVAQFSINFCFTFAAWAMSSWLPVMLAKRGLSMAEGLGFMALSALCMVPGYIAASQLTSRIGRKKTMVAFVLLASVSGFGFATAQTLTELYVWNFLLSFFNLGAWGVWNTWMGEIYPTPQRMQGYAWGVGVARVANAAAPMVVGTLIAALSVGATVAFISCFLVATAAAALFLPETEGAALE